MKGVLIYGLHHWGFSIRVPKASAGGKSFPYVPISTILGALSKSYCENYAVKNGTSCTKEFIDKYKGSLFWVAYGADESRLLPYSDIMREQRVSYKQKKYRSAEKLRDWFGVSAFGKTYGESVKFSIAVLLKDKVEDFVKYSWQIISLGSKESLVTIEHVEVVDVEESEEEQFSTSFFIPQQCLIDTGDFELQELPVLSTYNLTKEPDEGVFDKFWVPIRGPLIGGEVKVKKDAINEQCTVYRAGEKYVVTFKEGLTKWLK
ncbi:putative CRISPR-associated protein Cas5 [Sulfurisphaera tokodaii str. 7]|uniref:CRISPR-associated protein Cas5 n=1 Tax=Sulfurisphaera tokodaii (strain DSM 16993 / JCM 10545 / NBRC 100140 / 7) TaxID=273063 RepID=Q977B3_SULTO|nr:type I-A CRISPR-associated protein Cas5a [Sulfurisphaera tokodaii]BAB64981.1 putative CRISPR-associated protein Cas5 [Sulfurisphaera tokodaii str. 7]